MEESVRAVSVRDALPSSWACVQRSLLQFKVMAVSQWCFALWCCSWCCALGLMALRCRTEEFWVVLRIVVSARLYCYCPQPERCVAQQRDPVVSSERVRSIHSCCLWAFNMFSVWSWHFDLVVPEAFVNGLEFDSDTLLWVSSLPLSFLNFAFVVMVEMLFFSPPHLITQEYCFLSVILVFKWIDHTKIKNFFFY